MVFETIRKKIAEGTRQTAQTIGEFVKAGGKLPGEKGFDPAAIQADVDTRKQAAVKQQQAIEQGREVFKRPPGEAVTPFTQAQTPTPIQEQAPTLPGGVPLGSTEVIENPDGSIDFRLPDGRGARIDADGTMSADESGAALPITAEDIAGLSVKGLFTKGLIANILKVGGKNNLIKVGGLGAGFGGGGTVSSNVAVNTATMKLTNSFISKAAGGSLAAKIIKAVGITTLIGSYPFAGFIKEESLQTLSLGVGAAIRNNDIEGAEAALQEQKELLDPSTWEKIIAGVPYANIVKSLNDFYEAATIKVSIDSKIVADLKEQIASGETDAEYYARIRQERTDRIAQEKQEDAEYYANIEQLRKEAKEEERTEDAKFWAQVLEEREGRESTKRKADEDYWNQYYKEVEKRKLNSAPSNLKFGLL